jgi:FkbM family methyltransferase
MFDLFALTLTIRGTVKTLRYRLDRAERNEETIIGFLGDGKLYEPEVSGLFLRVVEQGDTVVDVGANVGYFSVLAAALAGSTGRVLSFEPDEENRRKLEENLLLNRFYAVEIVAAPAADAIAPVTFHINKDSNGGHALWDPGLFPGNVKSLAEPQSVAMTSTTLDAALGERGIDRVKLIKIDTEGCEQNILEGGRGLIEGAKVPFIVAELHEFGLEQMGHSQSSLRRFMKAMGYETFLLPQDGGLPHLIPSGTRINSRFFLNLLFSTQQAVERYWPEMSADSI